MILYGQYVVELGADGRWAAPDPFAAALAQGSVMTAGLDGCLWLYPALTWQAFVERVRPLALTNPAAREFTRHVFGRAYSLAPDGGRLALPPPLRSLAAIERELIMAGMIDHLELWSPERWQAQMARAGAAWEAGLAVLGV